MPWPTSEQERLRYFDELGLQDADESPQGTVNERLPEMLDHSFTVPFLKGVDGVCNLFRGEVLGLSLFCYNRPVDDDPQTREAFAQLQRLASARRSAPRSRSGDRAQSPLASGGRALCTWTCTASSVAAAGSWSVPATLRDQRPPTQLQRR